MTVKNNVFFMLTLPSSGKKVKYRPYTVKEEKGLIIAKTTEDADTIFESIKHIVDECTFNELDIKNLAYFDLQYIFSMLRAKSVGEEIELVGSCDCSPEAQTDTFINIEDVKYTSEIKSGKIKVEIPGSEYSLSLKYPTTEVMSSIINKIKDGTLDDTSTEIIAACIDAVWTQEEYYDSMTLEEKVDFIENKLIPKQLKEIKKFSDSLPQPYYEVEYNCVACGKHHKTDVKGIDRFFV